jgi:type II secretory pathway pseudopilin PulG
MDSNHRTYGFRLIELFVVLLLIAALAAIIIPAVNSAREAGRRATCLDRNMQIGLSFQNYASTFNNSFPPSASLMKAVNGGTPTVGGWSFMVRLLPFMEYNTLYRTLPANGDPEDVSNPAIVKAMNTQLQELICPSGPGNSAKGQTAGIINYKAMGASTRASLIMVIDPAARPPYGIMPPPSGEVPRHPDGAIFPGTGTRFADITDGQSHTIFLMETIDQAASRWMVGKEATLVGLPQASSPTGTAPQSPHEFFAQSGSRAASASSLLNLASASNAAIVRFLPFEPSTLRRTVQPGPLRQ